MQEENQNDILEEIVFPEDDVASAQTTPEAEKPAEVAPAPTEAELRGLVQKLVASGQRDAVKAIVQQYAARVSDVPEDKRAECIEQLKALEVKA